MQTVYDSAGTVEDRLARQRAKYDDPIGRYFACFHAATGEPIDFVVLTAKRDGRVEERSFSHAYHDAYGAISEWQRWSGEAPLSLLRNQSERRPGSLRQLQAFGRYLQTLFRSPPPALDVAHTDALAQPSRAWCTFDATDTAALQRWAKQRRMSISAVLLWTLHRAIGVRARQVSHACRWSIPVSLRGELRRGDTTGNHAVPLFIDLNGASSMSDAHVAIRSQLAHDLHWGAWHLMALLGRLDSRLYQNLIRRDEARLQASGNWFAIMSNIGSMTGDREVEARAVLPLVGRTSPVAGSALTWNGKMSLGLHVHAGLHHHRLHASDLLEAWVRELRRTCNCPRASTVNLREPTTEIVE